MCTLSQGESDDFLIKKNSYHLELLILSFKIH